MKVQTLFFTLFISLIFIQCRQNKAENNELEGTNAVDSSEIITEYIPKFDYDSTLWLDLADLDPTIVMDLRYATTNNFVGEAMYECGRCFMRPNAAKALVAVHKELQTKGLGLKMFDCYRPRPIQQKLWDKVPDPKYVARPWKGSEHNKGVAVDLTIVDADGNQLDMGTKYDYFGKEGHTYYSDFENPDVVKNRQLLRRTLRKYGYQHIRTEWWHYSYKDTVVSRKISDMLWECE